MVYLLNQFTYLVLLRGTFIFSVFLTLEYLLSLIELAGPGADGVWNIPFISLFFSIFAQHIAYAFNAPLLCDNLVDLFWMFCNTLGLIAYITWFSIVESHRHWLPMSQISELTQKILGIVLATLYIFLLSSRIYLRFGAPKKVDKRPFSLRQMGGISILFGQSLWKARLIGETKRLILARGILASSLLAGIVVFFYFNIFIGAFQELQSIPLQNTRTANGLIPYPDLILTGIWGVTIILGSGTSVQPNFWEAVKVLQLWDFNYSSNETTCNLLQQTQKYPRSYYDYLNEATISFDCPPLQSGEYYLDPPFEINGATYDGSYQPDLLITVDFNVLSVPESNSIVNIAWNSIQVMARMTDNTEDVLALTRPTIIIPGVNMVGMVYMEIHQTYKNPGVATLGIFENVKSTLVGQVNHLYPDPSTSPLIRHGVNVSTLRLSVARQPTQWNVIRDFKNNSFLGGFSKVGGLWTFLSGIFAAIFGSSLMRVLFGNKPISVFGFAHHWERDAIVKAYHTSYPEIREEMNVPPEKRGMLRLIQDHIVDLNLIDKPDLDEPECNELTVLHPGIVDSSSPLVSVPEA